jgi:hypothetical protein
MNRYKAISNGTLLVAAAATLSIAPCAAQAQVTAPSVYTTTIHVQGETAGTEFTDWATSGITVADADPADNPGGSPPFVDIGNVQVANDANFIYIHATMHGATTSLANLFLAFDIDQNLTTGFDPFGLGVVGSELGYQTDFPFGQATGVFNTGATLTGGPFGNGGALIYPFWTAAGAPQGNEIEWAVPRNVTINGAPAFADASFDFAIWTDNGLGDITQRISYTLAQPPAGVPGDYNNNGNVDAADYVVWKNSENTIATLPNDPHGGTIGANQYATWRANFGMSQAGAGSSSSRVPEPSALCVLASAAVLAALRRKTRGNGTNLLTYLTESIENL